MRYINLFNKAGPLADKVTLRLSQEYPMTVEYLFDVKKDVEGTLQFYLAPKIEDK